MNGHDQSQPVAADGRDQSRLDAVTGQLVAALEATITEQRVEWTPAPEVQELHLLLAQRLALPAPSEPGFTSGAMDLNPSPRPWWRRWLGWR